MPIPFLDCCLTAQKLPVQVDDAIVVPAISLVLLLSCCWLQGLFLTGELKTNAHRAESYSIIKGSTFIQCRKEMWLKSDNDTAIQYLQDAFLKPPEEKNGFHRFRFEFIPEWEVNVGLLKFSVLGLIDFIACRAGKWLCSRFSLPETKWFVDIKSWDSFWYVGSV